MRTRSGKTRLRRRDFLGAGAAGLAGLGMSLGPRLAGAAQAGAKIASDDEGDVYQVAVTLKTPKSGKDKRMGEALDTCSFSMFVPRGLKVIRGATFNPFYEPTVGQKHWRAAAACWGFAHVGANFFGVRADELGPTLLAALGELAAAAGHSETEHVPLCIHGMSIGGGLTSRLVEALPERTIAAAPVCLEVGPRDAASRRVPMITIFGERDGRQMELLEGKLPVARAEHALWAIAPQWNRRHEWHRASNLVMPFYDRVIPCRLAADAAPARGAVPLKAYDEGRGWLGDRSTWRTAQPRIAPLARYSGDRSRACWLPDAYVAAVWQAFVSHQPPLRITSPAGMSDGIPFETVAAGKPIVVSLQTDGKLDAGKIEIFDGDRRLAEAAGSPPGATLEDLPPGVHALIAVATMADGSRAVSSPNTIVVKG